MTAREKNAKLAERLTRKTGVLVTIADAETLRRAEITLTRWAEAECNGTIQRDETTGKPWRYHGGHYAGVSGTVTRWPIADRETGALARVAALCERLGLEYFHQTDPRGAALYVAKKGAGMNESNYSSVGSWIE